MSASRCTPRPTCVLSDLTTFIMHQFHYSPARVNVKINLFVDLSFMLFGWCINLCIFHFIPLNCMIVILFWISYLLLQHKIIGIIEDWHVVIVGDKIIYLFVCFLTSSIHLIRITYHDSEKLIIRNSSLQKYSEIIKIEKLIVRSSFFVIRRYSKLVKTRI